MDAPGAPATADDHGAGAAPLGQSMRPRAAAWLAWSLWALTVGFTALLVLFIALALAAGTPAASVRPIDLAFVVALVAFATVGALIVTRRPANAMGWLFCGVGLAMGITGFTRAYALYSLLAAPGVLPAGEALAWLHTAAAAAVTGALVTFVLLLFPHGHLPSRRWRPVSWLSAGGIVLVTAVLALKPGPLELGDVAFVRNPLGLEGAGVLLGGLEVLGVVLTVAGALGSAASMVVRLRSAHGVERLQLKWMAYAAALVGLATLIGGLLYFGHGAQAATNLGGPLLGLALAGIPIAAGFAILRYRLYEIDRLINRTLVYGLLTATLALIYFASVAVLQQVLRPLLGQGNELAIIASTLAIAALFNPLRHRIQAFIDWRFYRRKYDAAQVLAAFSARLRDETDMDQVADEVLTVVQETMQPVHVSLWLRPPQRPASSPPEQIEQ